MKAISLAAAALQLSVSVEAANTPVTWTSAENVDSSIPGFLQKNGGSDGWGTAGAISTQELVASSQIQGVSFQCGGTPHPMSITGLGNSNAGISFQDIDFALYCQTDAIEVYESGGDAGLFGAWTPDDVFKVQVNPDATVVYLKNDIVFHTSN